VLVAAVVTLVVGVGWTLLGSSVLAVQRVTVQGTSRLSAAAVLAAADVPRGESLLRVSPAAIERRVARLPAVAQVRVVREWPHRIAIRVTERRPVAVVMTPAGAVLLDRTGVAFATQPTTPAGLVPVELSQPVPGPGAGEARAAMQVLSALPPRLRRQVETVRADSPDAVTLRLRRDRTVVWGSADDTAAKLAVLRVLMRTHKATRYDVSTPGVAVTRS
jgi:cell division protein FtsQ